MSLEVLAHPLGVGVEGLRILLGVAALLAAGTLWRGLGFLRRRDEERRRRWRSLVVWWILFAVLLTVLALGRPGALVAAATLSLLLLREVLRLTGSTRLLPYLVASALAVYLWAWLDWRSLFLVAVPLVGIVVLFGEVAWRAGLRPVPGKARPATLAILTVSIGPAFLVAVASLPPPAGRPGSPLGWLVLLVLLTELNDIAQAWWGEFLGSRPLAPVLSPAKTWEGLWGGVATTCLAAVVMAPALTSYGRAAPSGLPVQVPAWTGSLTAGLVVALAGVAGDLGASALKRRAGVKDAGRLLPGHGGVLDRFDSLTLSAPAFLFLTLLLWFPWR